MRDFCNTEMLSSHLDSRFVFCERCHVKRCGYCGGVLTIKFRKSRYQDIAEWVVPKKVSEFLIQISRSFICSKCGRRFPYKSDFIRYIFWEIRVFHLNLFLH